MKICYYLDLPSKQYLWFARKSIMRAKKLMRHAQIQVLTVPDFPDLDLGAEIVRMEGLPPVETTPYAHRGLMAFSRIEGDVLFMDVDCILKRDVSHVFDTEFDVAACIRMPKNLKSGLPFQGGVWFSRCPEFWKEFAGKPEDHGDWVDTERRFARIALSDRYIIRALNSETYNYVPENPEEDVSKPAIVHYKGPRKDWMFPPGGLIEEAV